MKLYQIHESPYDDLDDTDQFGVPIELAALTKFKNWLNSNYLQKSWEAGIKFSSNDFDGIIPAVSTQLERILIEIFGYEICDEAYWSINTDGLNHEDLNAINAAINQHQELKDWWEDLAIKPERLQPSYGKLNESSPYDELDDQDHFKNTNEYSIAGRFTIEPHNFTVWETYDRVGRIINRDIAIDQWDDLYDIPKPLRLKLCKKFAKLLPQQLRQQIKQPPATLAWLSAAMMLYWDQMLDSGQLKESSPYEKLDDADHFEETVPHSYEIIGQFMMPDGDNPPHEFMIWEWYENDTPHEEVSIDHWDIGHQNINNIPDKTRTELSSLFLKEFRRKSRDLLLRIEHIPFASKEWLKQAVILYNDYVI